MTVINFKKLLKILYMYSIIYYKGGDNMQENNTIRKSQLLEWEKTTKIVREIAKKKNVDLSKILLVKKEKL